MGIRDNELARIVKYAQGLGIKVVWKQHVPGQNTGATWSEDVNGTEIEMYMWPDKSKTKTILDFIHELAHHMAWVESGRKMTKKSRNAFSAFSNAGKVPKVKER